MLSRVQGDSLKPRESDHVNWVGPVFSSIVVFPRWAGTGRT